MSEKRPTDSAKMHFGIAQTHSRMAHQIAAKDKGDDGMYKSHVAIAIYESSNNRREERNRLMPAKRSGVKGNTPRWD